MKGFKLTEVAKKILKESSPKKQIKPYTQVKVGDTAFENPDAGGEWDNELGEVLWKGTYKELMKSKWKDLAQDWLDNTSDDIKDVFDGYDLVVVKDGYDSVLYNYDNDPSGCVVFE